MRFADTNILLYAASPAPGEADKQQRAADLLAETDLAISVQVLAEFYAQATRPSRAHRLPAEEASGFLAALHHVQVQPVTVEVFEAGVRLSSRFGLSYWDGAILAAAKVMGCDAVYSEDMSADQDYDGLRVINPFDAS